MNQVELDKGKKLADKSLKWWSSTMPGFEQDQYVDEPIPLLVKWLKQHAFPELERHDDTVISGPDLEVVIPESVIRRARKK